MSFPGAAKVRVDVGPTVKVVVNRFRAQYSRAGKQRLNLGDIDVTVQFPTPLADNNFIPVGTVGNPTDNPNLAPVITAHPYSVSANSVVFRLSAATPTENYYLYWSLAEVFNP